MKNEKGITLVALITTVALIGILASVTISYGKNYMDVIQLQDFEYEMKQVQGKVNVLHEKIQLGENEYITLGKEITNSASAMNVLKNVKGVDYNNIAEEDRTQYYYNDTNTYYRYLTEADVQELLDISSSPGDMIINFITREIISVNGVTYKGNVYRTLEDI